MKTTFFLILGASLLVLGYFALQIAAPKTARPVPTGTITSNVSMADGKQIITVRAKGGYTPRVSIAKAGIPTILKFDTQGTFDCSSAVVIPSMNVSQTLPPSGVTEIALGTLE